MSAVPFSVDDVLSRPDLRIVVCCGSGGVGKTTTAAALGVRAAEQGRKVALLTIDPARRLAQSLGLTHLDNSPKPVPSIDTAAGGSLDAMMLDMKRTFDEIVEAHASPEAAAAILENPFYVSLSSSFAGTQEYMAMEKLGQLRSAQGGDGSPRWDLIIVDTPPSRSALDFLDAPSRLGSFLDNRFMRTMSAPARLGGRVYSRAVSAGLGMAAGVMAKVLGAQLLTDVQNLVTALDSTLGGFRVRAEHTYAMLKSADTVFMVVAAPASDALREAGYFFDRLQAESIPLAGVVVNRVQRPLVVGLPGEVAVRAAGEAEPAHALVADLLRMHAQVSSVATRQQRIITEFVARHPGVPLRSVAAQGSDVHDVEGLRGIGAELSLR